MHVLAGLLAAVTAASAFLIPPEINTDDLKDIISEFKSLTADIYKQSYDAFDMKTLVELGCDECYGNNKENGRLILNIEIPDPKKNTLMINSVPIIPFNPFQLTEITVPMTKQDHSVLDYLLLGSDDSLVDVRLGYDLMMTETIIGNHKTINLKIRVSTVDGMEVPAGNADDVEFTLYKDEETGELFIVGLDVNREMPELLEEGEFTCASFFCRVQEIMEKHFKSFKEKAEAQFDSFRSKLGGKKGCHGKHGSPTTLPPDFDINNHPHRRPHSMYKPIEANEIKNSEQQISLKGYFSEKAIGFILGLSFVIFAGYLFIFAIQSIQRVLERRRRVPEDTESSKGLLAQESTKEPPPSYRDVEKRMNVAVVDSADDKQ